MRIQFIYLISACVVGLVLASTIYIEMAYAFAPCLLCLLQRAALLVIGVLFLFNAALKQHYIRQIFNGFLLFLSAGGFLLSVWQLWLQHLPAQNGNICGVGLKYLLQTLSLKEVFQKMLHGEIGECVQQTTQTIFFLNMAEWSALCFGMLFVYLVYLCRRECVK